MRKYTIYTDGGCTSNGTAHAIGGYGAVILRDDKTTAYVRGEGPVGTTNNQMELKAVIEAIAFISKETSGRAEILVRTDSQLVIGWVALGWKRKVPATFPYLEALDALVRAHQVTFEHVRGHNGDHHNEIADRLAALSMAEAMRDEHSVGRILTTLRRMAVPA